MSGYITHVHIPLAVVMLSRVKGYWCLLYMWYTSLTVLDNCGKTRRREGSWMEGGREGGREGEREEESVRARKGGGDTYMYTM